MTSPKEKKSVKSTMTGIFTPHKPVMLKKSDNEGTLLKGKSNDGDLSPREMDGKVGRERTSQTKFR